MNELQMKPRAPTSNGMQWTFHPLKIYRDHYLNFVEWKYKYSYLSPALYMTVPNTTGVGFFWTVEPNIHRAWNPTDATIMNITVYNICISGRHSMFLITKTL